MSIFGCKKYNQFYFSIDHLVISMCRVFFCVVGREVCYDECVLLAKLYKPLPCFILYSKAKFACYSGCFLTSYFCILVPCNKQQNWATVVSITSLTRLQAPSHRAFIPTRLQADPTVARSKGQFSAFPSEAFPAFQGVLHSIPAQTCLLAVPKQTPLLMSLTSATNLSV